MAYLLDANVLVEAKRHHYAPDFCPAFWNWLHQQNEAGVVFSIEKVGDEIGAGKDAAAKWAADHGERFFLPEDEALLDALPRVSEWVRRQKYKAGAINAFLRDADYYLVSFALAHDLVVVTHEVPEDGVKQVKIPEVCIGLKIKHMSPFTMLRREAARFVLGPKGT